MRCYPGHQDDTANDWAMGSFDGPNYGAPFTGGPMEPEEAEYWAAVVEAGPRCQVATPPPAPAPPSAYDESDEDLPF